MANIVMLANVRRCSLVAMVAVAAESAKENVATGRRQPSMRSNVHKPGLGRARVAFHNNYYSFHLHFMTTHFFHEEMKSLPTRRLLVEVQSGCRQ